MRRRWCAFAALLIATLASAGLGCFVVRFGPGGRPPRVYELEKSRTYDISYDAVWERLTHFFASQNIQIKTIEKDSGVIYAERASFSPDLADCGDPGLAQPLSRSLNMNVFVAHVEGGITATVTTTFKETRQFSGGAFAADCNSAGVFERQVLDSLE